MGDRTQDWMDARQSAEANRIRTPDGPGPYPAGTEYTEMLCQQIDSQQTRITELEAELERAWKAREKTIHANAEVGLLNMELQSENTALKAKLEKVTALVPEFHRDELEAALK